MVMHRGSAINSSADAPTACFDGLLREALSNPPKQGPSLVPVGSTDRWESFMGAFHIHFLHGNHATRRIHLSSHQLEQQVVCGTVKKAAPCYYYKAAVGVWCIEKVKRSRAETVSHDTARGEPRRRALTEPRARNRQR